MSYVLISILQQKEVFKFQGILHTPNEVYALRGPLDPPLENTILQLLLSAPLQHEAARAAVTQRFTFNDCQGHGKARSPELVDVST